MIDTRRRIIIGDVHGCLGELMELLRKCDYRGPQCDRLIFAGDLVDKGPASQEVVQVALTMRAECVLGNHDEKHLRWNRWNKRVAQGEADKNPMRENEFYWDFNDAEWDYFMRMPRFIDIDQDVSIVHAGFECNSKPRHEQDPKIQIRIRDVHPISGNYYSTGDPTVRAEGAVRWATRWGAHDGALDHRHAKVVIYGHAPGYSIKRDSAMLGWVCFGIDTGCVHGGLLTALVFEPNQVFDHSVVQVRAKQKYCKTLVEGEDYVRNCVVDDPRGA